MNVRNAIKAVFGTIKQRVSTAWREIGGYSAIFSSFSGTAYANDTCRACIRALAEHSSKANARAGDDKKLEALLNVRPNMYMNGKDFLYKVRTLLEIHNTVMIYINRDDTGRCTGLYPMPQCASEAVDVDGELFIRFWLPDGNQMVAAWADLAVLRKDYNTSDIWGDSNDAIKGSLDLLNTANQGMANAIKATANLRGILKTTKGMISDDDRKRMKDGFVADYMALENTSGIAMLDSTLDYTPMNVTPQIANYKHVEELRNNIYRYYGMNEKAITSQLVGDDWEAFYEAKIEPFLIALSMELSYKIYTDRRRAFGANIVYESNRMQYLNTNAKLAMQAMVDRGAMTPNEWRAVLNLAPIDGGDVPIRRLDTQPTKGVDDNADNGKSGIQGNGTADPGRSKETE